MAVVASATGLLSVTPGPVRAGSASDDLVVNGGFESGDLAGWTAVDHPEPYEPLAVVGAGVVSPHGLFTTEPTGSAAVLHAFDGGGPGSIDLYQELDLPADRLLTLRFELRAGWDLDRWCAGCAERTFDVVVEPVGGGPARYVGPVLAPAPGSFVPDTGPLDVEVDLSSFAGERVRLVLRAAVSGDYTGPARLQLDQVRVEQAPLPPDGVPVGPAAPVVAPRDVGVVPLPSAPASAVPTRPSFTG